MIDRRGDLVHVAGALTIDTAANVCADIVRQFGAQPLVIDLASISEVDSAALSAIFELKREAKRRQTEVSFTNIPQSLFSLATLYGVAELLKGACGVVQD